MKILKGPAYTYMNLAGSLLRHISKRFARETKISTHFSLQNISSSVGLNGQRFSILAQDL